MSAQRLDVLAVMDECALAFESQGGNPVFLRQARDAVRELVEADREYDDARKDWDDATSEGADLLSDDDWRRIADRHEAAIMRRIAALERFGGTP
jgi:hypothetical protein